FDGKHLDAAKRLAALDDGIRGLALFIDYMRQTDENRDYLNAKILTPARNLRARLTEQAQKDREDKAQKAAESQVDKLTSTLEGKADLGKEFEADSDDQKKKVLRTLIHKLINTSEQLAEFADSLHVENLD